MEIGRQELGKFYELYNKNMTIKLKDSNYTKPKMTTLHKKSFFQLL